MERRMNECGKIWLLQLLLAVTCVYGLKVSSVTESSVTLTWTASKATYQNFTVRYSLDNGLNYSYTVPDSDWKGEDVTTTIDENLEAGQLYEIEVFGYTVNGDTVPVHSPVSQSTKPYPPTSVTVIGATTDSLDLTWVDNTTDYVPSYIVHYKDLTNDTASMTDVSVNETKVTLTRLQPGHVYSITIAAMTFGVESNETTPLTDNTVPLPPRSISVVALNESALYVIWTPNSDSEQDSYEVMYRTETGAETPVTCLDHLSNECTVATSGDMPGELYTVKVRAVKGSRASSSLSAERNTRPLSPVELKPVNITMETMELQWRGGDGSKDEGYLINLLPADASQSLQNKTDLSVVFDGLTSGQTYQVTVIAYAGEEESDPLAEVFWTVPVAPVVRYDTTNDTIMLSWDSPAGQRDNYSVVAEEAHSGVGKEKIVPGTEIGADVTDLNAGSVYTVTVVAQSGDKRSEPTVLNNITTVPNPVEDLMVADTDMESVLVSWKPPYPPTSVVEQYIITVAPLSGYPKHLSPDTISYNITDLVPGTQYEVTITVRSRGGAKESQARNITVTTIPPSVESLVVTTETDTVTVSWELSNEMNFDLLNISLSNTSGLLHTVTRNKGSSEPHNHTFVGLESGNLYTVTIVTSLSDGTVGRPINKTAVTKPVPIKDISVDVSESYSLDISWSVHPAEAHGYLVRVIDQSDETSPQRNVTVKNGYNTLVDGLQPGHHYAVIVQAFVNYLGTQLYSDGVAKNTTTKPLPVMNLSGQVFQDNITVTWQANPEPSRQDDYQLSYRTVLRDPNSAWSPEVFTQLTSETILELFPGEQYDIRVWARAGTVLSDVREISFIIAPLPPQSVTVENTTTDSLYLNLLTEEHNSHATHWNFTFTPGTTSSPVLEKSVPHPYTNPIEVSGLSSGETYSIEVYAVTVNETKSEISVVTSATIRPVLDSELAEVSATNSSIKINYTENSAIFDTYLFQLENYNPQTCGASDTPREIEFSNQLIAGRSVRIKTWVSKAGVTSDEKSYTFQTYPNKAIAEFDVRSEEIYLSLTKPGGDVDYYNVSCYHGDTSCGSFHVDTSVSNPINISGLAPFQDYIITIITVSGEKFVTEKFPKQTLQSAPSEVRAVSAHVTSPNTVLVRWEQPAESNGEITKYKVEYVGKLQGKPDDKKTIELPGLKVPPTNITIKDLLAQYSYTFYVSAYTVTYGPPGVHTLTVAAYPPPFKDSLNTEDLLPTIQSSPTPSTVQLKFVNAFSDKGGEILAYTVIVSTDNSTEQKMPTVLPGWQTAQTDRAIKAYQAIANCTDFFSPTSDCHTANKVKRSTSTEFTHFTIGTETGCDKKVYCNGPLKPDTEYYIALRAFTVGGPSDTPYSKKIRTASLTQETDPGPVIGGVLAGLLIIIIIVLVVVFYRIRQRRPNMYKKEDHEMHEDLHVKRSSSRRPRTSRVIKLADFPDHFQMMSADSDYRFAEEFEELREVGRDQSCDAAELPQNRAKNRFTNILPYDHSRVKLLPTDDEEGSDYINANYMPGSSSRREYIVTQGPLPSTRDDFWRLVWEQNCRNIIMLTRCVEKGREKCDHYWPQNSESMFYGDLQVAIMNEIKFPDWTITEFNMSLGDNSRKIRHFHYTGWPDFGVPERPQSLVKFVKTVREKLITAGAAQLVHCSAGVGRSGTYIALDHLLQHIKHNDWLDPFNIVYEMRRQRVWMVQTEQQYICIHQCLLSVLQGFDDEPVYCNQAHDNVGFEDKKDTLPLCPPETEDEKSATDDEGINVEIM